MKKSKSKLSLPEIPTWHAPTTEDTSKSSGKKYENPNFKQLDEYIDSTMNDIQAWNKQLVKQWMGALAESSITSPPEKAKKKLSTPDPTTYFPVTLDEIKINKPKTTCSIAGCPCHGTYAKSDAKPSKKKNDKPMEIEEETINFFADMEYIKGRTMEDEDTAYCDDCDSDQCDGTCTW